MSAKSLASKAKATSVPMGRLPDVVLIPPDRLFLDPNNPRLAEQLFRVEDQYPIAEWLWKNKAVNEIVDSILASQFWAHEELFATEEDGRLVVIEGNRRLAAVKVILDPALQSYLRVSFEKPRDAVVESLKLLPVIITSRRDVWQFIGFKHVNGPQEWDSIAKAKYVYSVRQNFDVPLAEIAKSIGDRHDTVARLYRGYLVLKQAQDEELFQSEDAYARKFPFSHLWTGLGYSSVQKYLGVDSETLLTPNPVPSKRLPKLKSFMTWVFGSRSREVQPIIKSQNPDLRNLATALENAKGIQILEAGLPLSAAVEASRGDVALFRDSIVNAESSLRDAKRYVATGYDGDEALLETAAQVATIASSLRREMAAMQHPEAEDEE